MMRGLLFSLLCQQALKRQGRPSGLIGQYKPYLNSNDSPTRDILKDYSGQGHDIQLYNFGYELGSGYGLYKENYNNWQLYQSQAKFTNTDSKFNITKNIATGQFATLVTGCKAHKIKVTGLTDGQNLKVAEFWSSIDPSKIYLIVEKDGIYEVPEVNSRMGYNLSLVQESCNITIEQIPDYPGALVSDGVDDYGLCENFPILTKEKGYTVFALRKILGSIDTITAKSCLVSNYLSTQEGAFYVEYFYDDKSWRYLSWGIGGKYDINLDTSLIVQTTNKYNNESINSGSALVGTNKLQIFKLTNWNGYLPCALYALEIYNHDLTDEEIQSVKEAMYNEYLTATNALQNHIIADYECYDKTNEDEDRDVLKDLSGNGNDIQLYNFGFAEGSGYGKYAVNFNNFTSYSERGELTKTSSVIHITNVLTNAALIEYQNDIQMPSYKIKVTGLSNSGKTIRYDASKYPSNNYLVIIEDGIYDLPASDISSQFSGGFRVLETGPCNITIEQIPEYKGALVSDGVDDYGNCDNFPILNKEDGYTIIAIRKIISENDKSRFFITNTLDANAGPNTGAFCFERLTTTNNVTLNWGSANVVKINKELSLTYQTSKNYNGTTLNLIGNNTAQPYLRLFSWYGTLDNMSAALYALKIFDRDLTDEEIAYEKKKMIQKYYDKTGDPSLYAIARYECYDKTNEDSDRNILKDLTGNGHDITLNNFAFAESSGYGKYVTNFSKFSNQDKDYNTATKDKITINYAKNGSVVFSYFAPVINCKIKITGVSEAIEKGEITKVQIYCKDDSTEEKLVITADGEYIINSPNASDTNNFYIFPVAAQSTVELSSPIVIEQIPDYKGALVSDGIDDYGICENFPILKKEKGYTVVALRKILNTLDVDSCFINQGNGTNWSFVTDLFFNNRLIVRNWSGNIYVSSITSTPTDLFVYQNSKTYNGIKDLIIGDYTGETNSLILFSLNKGYLPMSVALYALEIYPRDLTESEIQIVKDRMIKQYESKTGETIN